LGSKQSEQNETLLKSKIIKNIDLNDLNSKWTTDSIKFNFQSISIEECNIFRLL